MVGCPVFMVEIGTLLADFVEFLYAIIFQTLGRPVLSLQIGTLFPVFAEVLYLVRSAPSLNERQASFLVLWFFNNSSNFCTSGADLFLLSHDDGTVASAVNLFKGKGGGRSVIVHRIPVVLQSKKRREKRFRTFGMAVSFEDALASTCPRFVKVLRVRRYRLGIERGAVYYLKSSNDTFVRVGESTSRSPHNLKYTADVAFIKKYSVLLELGERFQWEKARDFEDWLASIVNARPKFIQPFCRSVNALPVLVASPHAKICTTSFFCRSPLLLVCGRCPNQRSYDSDSDQITILSQCKFQIQLSDSTGYIIATAFGEQADSMFSITGDYLRNNMQERLDETEGQTSVPIPKASATAMQTAEPTEPFAPEVQPLPTTMEGDATTEASKSDAMEEAITASKNPKKHRTFKNKKD
ncbi:hypothetical protein RHSIM_Rhsim07G0090000 [Rhododendron simsii]|uniref:Replication factor A C-terminal domain-containing protein n=1 Tax=Rhododendron simsii TaxID=118357 RepID=A0A834GTA2_RHOSS|nr:hypothetical protein RHSIM_Rhsim07G0090000 [Rhododendron simsii]